MDSKLQEQSISLRRTRDLLRVTFVNNLLFDLGSARIREKGGEALSKIAEFLGKQKDKMIQVEGHTDNRPIKGNLLSRYPSNWELLSRALSPSSSSWNRKTYRLSACRRPATHFTARWRTTTPRRVAPRIVERKYCSAAHVRRRKGRLASLSQVYQAKF